MSKEKDTPYLALTAMLRAREAKMLDRDRMDRMLNASSYADAAKLLVDCKYEDMSGLDSKMLDAVLNARKEGIFEEVYRMSPEKEPVEVFRLKYDYHNAKVIVKAAGVGVGGDHLLSDVGRVSADVIAKAYAEDHYSALPAALGKAVKEAKLMLAKSGNPQLAEFILDRAYFEEMTALANQQGSAFLQGYVKVMIDSANLRTAVRTVRMNKGIDFLMQALIAGGNVSPAKMAQAAVSGDGLAALFTATVLQNAAAAGVEDMKGGSMTKFELACDNAVTAYLGGAKMVSFGCQPVIKYLALVEAETTAVRMILSGKMAGIAPHVIRERLREIDA